MAQQWERADAAAANDASDRRGSDDQHRRLNVTPLQPTTMRACAGPSDAPEALSRVEGEMTAFQIRSALIWFF